MLTIKQIDRAYRKLWERITEGDGYQPFGYDAPTMRMNHPGYFPAVARLREMAIQLQRDNTTPNR